MRNISMLLMYLGFAAACATTRNTTEYGRNPETGKMELSKRVQVDTHNYADPFGDGMKKAADAEAARKRGEACAELVRQQGSVTVENLPHNASFYCDDGTLEVDTTEGDTFMYYPYGSTRGYRIRLQGRGVRSAPITILEPMSGVQIGDPSIVSYTVATYTPPSVREEMMSQARGGVSGEDVELAEVVTSEDKRMLTELRAAAAKCDEEVNAKVSDRAACREAVERYRSFSRELWKKRDLFREERLGYSMRAPYLPPSEGPSTEEHPFATPE